MAGRWLGGGSQALSGERSLDDLLSPAQAPPAPFLVRRSGVSYGAMMSQHGFDWSAGRALLEPVFEDCGLC